MLELQGFLETRSESRVLQNRSASNQDLKEKAWHSLTICDYHWLFQNKPPKSKKHLRQVSLGLGQSKVTVKGNSRVAENHLKHSSVISPWWTKIEQCAVHSASAELRSWVSKCCHSDCVNLESRDHYEDLWSLSELWGQRHQTAQHLKWPLTLWRTSLNCKPCEWSGSNVKMIADRLESACEKCHCHAPKVSGLVFCFRHSAHATSFQLASCSMSWHNFDTWFFEFAKKNCFNMFQSILKVWCCPNAEDPDIHWHKLFMLERSKNVWAGVGNCIQLWSAWWMALRYVLESWHFWMMLLQGKRKRGEMKRSICTERLWMTCLCFMAFSNVLRFGHK